MLYRIPQSVAIRVPIKAYLSIDHISDATGMDPAVVISKNGAGFGNPDAGATVATEVANGWYYVDLSAIDTNILGPPILRATHATMDNAEVVYQVVSATSIAPFGAGAVPWAYTLTDSISGAPIDGAEVWVTTDSGGLNVISSGVTDAFGVVNFMLDVGTVYVWRKKSGYNFVNPDVEVVA